MEQLPTEFHGSRMGCVSRTQDVKARGTSCRAHVYPKRSPYLKPCLQNPPMRVPKAPPITLSGGVLANAEPKKIAARSAGDEEAATRKAGESGEETTPPGGDENLSQNRLKRMTRQASWTKPRKFWAWYSQRMRI